MLFCSLALGQTTVKVIETSSTKKSLIIDKGTFEGVQVGQEGSLYKNEGSQEEANLIKVADVRVVKSVKKHSFWFVTKMENKNFLNPDSILTFFGKNEVVSGRRDLEMRELLVVGDDQDLSLKDEEYVAIEKYNNTEVVKDKDVEFFIHSDFEKKGISKNERGKDKLIKGAQKYKRKDKKKLKKYYNDKIYKNTLDGSVKKLSNNSLTGLYRKSPQDPHIKWLKKKGWIYNTYQSSTYDRRNDILVNPRAVKRIKNEGDMWSASLNDKELRDYFMKNGIAEERRRQNFAIDNRIGNEAFIRYSWNTSVNYSDTDQNNQGQGYSFVFGYEYHLIRAIKGLENWSVDVFWELALDYYDLGNINGKAQMSFLGGYFNYYFYNMPTSIKKFIWYAGVGMKFGSAQMENPELNATYGYGVQALPSYQLGIKYRFDPGDEVDDIARIGWGINFLFQTSLLKFSTNDQIVDDINGSFEAQDTRFSIGLAFIF